MIYYVCLELFSNASYCYDYRIYGLVIYDALVVSEDFFYIIDVRS